jgi:EAL domain-containing protein (putative c-di-GMP-specific phosphodiesterase class I)
LGATLYHLLTGVIPFGASYINAKIHPNLELPEIPSVTKQRDVPPELDEVIRKALCKNPELRQRSAKLLWDEFKWALSLNDLTNNDLESNDKVRKGTSIENQELRHAANSLQLKTDIRRALERDEFFIQYQPIVALDNFSLRGFEALVRWQHPTRGLISPMDFIPVAEETGQIVAVGQWALREACRQMSRWQRRYPSETPLFISVNLSSRQFTQPDLLEQVRFILDETKLDPRCLKLEITESVVMENIDKATEMLRQLRALGVRLAIDDFGTGYSSLSYLHRFPIDTLKVDRSFVMRMVDNNENIEIVRTILMLAQNLGMDVVAEGVETKEQLALLRKLGCENGQGYFFSRPVSVGGAEKIITETTGGAAQDMSHVKVIRPVMVA